MFYIFQKKSEKLLTLKPKERVREGRKGDQEEKNFRI
jgi:hypothetical protein